MKQRIGQLSLLVMIMGMVLTTGCADRQEVSREFVKEGRRLLSVGMNDEAQETFERAIRKDKKNFEAWFYLGNMYVTNREYEKSMEYYEHAIELKPDYARAWYNLGMAWFYLNDREKACYHWKQAEDLGMPNIGDRTRHCR